ncbi:tellurite resistance TerB family protein [Paraglaciecola aestuariivivens]
MSLSNLDFNTFIRIWVWVSLVLMFVEAYLTVNKIWSRKHEKVVAESISISAQLLALCTGLPFVAWFYIEGTYEGMIAEMIFLGVNLLFIAIGAGMWLQGYRSGVFWRNFRQAIRLDQKEAGNLLKDMFRPVAAEELVAVLDAMARLDDHLDPREQALINDFAKTWDVPQKSLPKPDPSHCQEPHSLLRSRLTQYLHRHPPREQILQVADLMTVIAQADNDVSLDEQLVLNETRDLLNAHLAGSKLAQHHVLLVPQSKAQIKAISDLHPHLPLATDHMGTVFKVGCYHTRAYARVVKQWYSDSGFLSLVVDQTEAKDCTELTPNPNKPALA